MLSAAPEPAWASFGLDPTFDGDGRVITRSPTDAYRIAVSPDESILALERTSLQGFRLIRYLGDGSRDSTYADNGVADVALADVCPGCWEMDTLAIALQTDGKALVGGTVTEAKGSFANELGFVTRFDTNGDIDTSFGNAGSAFADLCPRPDISWITAIAVLPTGDIVAAGTGGSAVALARFSDTGVLDPTFGESGVARPTLMNGWTQVGDLLVRSDDKLVVAGTHLDKAFFLARLQPDGSADTSFAGSGVVTTTFGHRRAYADATDVALQPDGKFVVVGSKGGTMTLVRYRALGTLDVMFGDAGKIRTRLRAEQASGAGLTLRPSGRILVGGSRLAKRRTFFVAAYGPHGHLDHSFGSKGIVTTGFGRPAYASTAMAAPGDKFVIAGGNWKHILMARYLLS